MSHLDSFLRKAAVLVLSLDKTTAQSLLARLATADAEQIRVAVSSLGSVSALEQQQVIAEFLRRRVRPDRQHAGVELDEALARRFAGETQQRESGPVASLPKDHTDVTPFAFLLEAEAEVVAPFLKREAPQTVAVVLSFLQRRQAAELLQRFDASFQSQVLQRLANLDQIDPNSIHVVAEELRAWIERQRSMSPFRVGDENLGREMLQATVKRDRTKFIAELQSDVRRLQTAAPKSSGPDAPPPTPRRLQFEELVQLGDSELLQAYQATPQELLTLALAGASEELLKRIMRIVPRREAKHIKRGIRVAGPLRLADVDEAKRRMAEIASGVVAQSAASTWR